MGETETFSKRGSAGLNGFGTFDGAVFEGGRRRF
jgi:hypothetical protein